jgi:hypothetical protein
MMNLQSRAMAVLISKGLLRSKLICCHSSFVLVWWRSSPPESPEKESEKQRVGGGSDVSGLSVVAVVDNRLMRTRVTAFGRPKRFRLCAVFTGTAKDCQQGLPARTA